ncbi:hypothetical protein GW17_00017529 [Ensete ventricosum]|uniref:Uncharacterized protein n=1 Tax=Ensete ventricosum TaxID=4639 RepID=A0A426XM87_ENSVE|nr:hypothetical protein B296_00058422 [Ensete ventricosum]RWW18485.1 hypothetical protein GW17_00017529 [Ensete ventricosum]
MAWRLVLCSRSSNSNSWIHPPALLYSHSLPRSAAAAKERERRDGLKVYGRSRRLRSACLVACRAKKRSGMVEDGKQAWEDGRPLQRVQQAALWAAEAAYILWLFLLPYAPGDPIWAIKSTTINDLVGLSLNFFFILPWMNAVGIHVLEAPVLHPVRNSTLVDKLLLLPSFAFAFCLLLAFLIPYMAIRLNDMDVKHSYNKLSQLGSLMTKGSSVVGAIGGTVCVASALWTFFGRPDAAFGGVADRWDFLLGYVGSERLAYAFIWDIGLYAMFQPWLIGDNLHNVKKSSVSIVSNLRFIPVLGLVAYTLCLEDDKGIS